MATFFLGAHMTSSLLELRERGRDRQTQRHRERQSSLMSVLIGERISTDKDPPLMTSSKPTSQRPHLWEPPYRGWGGESIHIQILWGTQFSPYPWTWWYLPSLSWISQFVKCGSEDNRVVVRLTWLFSSSAYLCPFVRISPIPEPYCFCHKNNYDAIS